MGKQNYDTTEFVQELKENYMKIYHTDKPLIKEKELKDLGVLIWVTCIYDTDYDEKLHKEVDILYIKLQYRDSLEKTNSFCKWDQQYNKEIFDIESYMENELKRFEINFRKTLTKT